MGIPFALDAVLAVGVDPHRQSLDVMVIHFPDLPSWPILDRLRQVHRLDLVTPRQV
jgi:hypothetical protein